MHLELHPLTLLALKAGPRRPHLGLSIGGKALGGNQYGSGLQPTTQTNKQTMTSDQELFASVTKFNDLLRTGMKAQLMMECENGRARVKLEMLLRPSAHLGQRDGVQHPQARARRAAGSARRRRRERRAEARERQASEDAAAQDAADTSNPPQPGPAVAAVLHPPPHLSIHSPQDPAADTVLGQPLALHPADTADDLKNN